jgi:hypothetical protein
MRLLGTNLEWGGSGKICSHLMAAKWIVFKAASNILKFAYSKTKQAYMPQKIKKHLRI